jgi:ACT domain-containing protein
MKGATMKCVISVLGKDRSGIVAAVAVVLAECGANIDDISQTILNDIFSMTMLTTLDTEKADFDTVQDKLKAVGEDLGVQIIIQREDVFQYMYKI